MNLVHIFTLFRKDGKGRKKGTKAEKESKARLKRRRKKKT
jgi:hypothetical protein